MSRKGAYYLRTRNRKEGARLLRAHLPKEFKFSVRSDNKTDATCFVITGQLDGEWPQCSDHFFLIYRRKIGWELLGTPGTLLKSYEKSPKHIIAQYRAAKIIGAA